MSEFITLFPSNWLYNSGVIGLLRVLEKCGEKINFKDDGTAEIDLNSFKNEVYIDNEDEFNIPIIAREWLLMSWDLLTNKNSITEKEMIKEVWGKLFNQIYRGFFNANSNQLYKSSKSSEPLIVKFGSFISSLSEYKHSEKICSFCFRESNFSYKNIFTSEHSQLLGASSGEKGVINSFWNLKPGNSLNVCDFCSFVLISQHLAFIPLSDGSQIFINAPSFKLMFALNKFVDELMGFSSIEENRTKREILAMSLIEYATKVKTTLGVWSEMNIEIINKGKDGSAEFFNISHEVVKLLLDREIASMLSGIGEFRILNNFIDGKFPELIELGYKFLRIGLKPFNERTKNEREFINDYLKLDKNKKNPQLMAEKIFKLCAFVEEKQKGGTIENV